MVNAAGMDYKLAAFLSGGSVPTGLAFELEFFADLIGHGPREEVGDIVRCVAVIGGDDLHIHFEEMANIDVVHI